MLKVEEFRARFKISLKIFRGKEWKKIPGQGGGWGKGLKKTKQKAESRNKMKRKTVEKDLTQRSQRCAESAEKRKAEDGRGRKKCRAYGA